MVALVASAMPGQAPAMAQRDAARPVQVGQDGPEFDACGSTGRPRGLNPKGDNFLSVKAAPSLRARRTDRLVPSSSFYICGTTAGGAWTAIVFAPGGRLSAGCGVATPVVSPRPYRGPCRSGWVSSEYVHLVAG